MIKLLKNSLQTFLTGLFVLIGHLDVAFAQKEPLTLIRDAEIENILREWGAPVFKAANLDPKAINIILIQSDDVNAFVAGGSNIFIYTGLISKTKTPGELIGVLAHETGHIAGGHLIKGREALERASYESIIGTILGVGVAVLSGDAGAVPALSVGGSSLAQRRYLAHSRVHESSADQAALTFLEKAKINPTGTMDFMNTLKADHYVPEAQRSEYTQTHPLTDNRIEALKHRIETSAYKSKPYPEKWLEQHARIKAKLAGFIHPEQIPWVYDDKDTSLPAQYARAIAAYRNNKVDDALSRIDALLKIEPKNPYFLELKGQMLVDFGKVQESVPYYRKALKLLPDGTLLRIALAHALIESHTKSDGKIVLLTEAVTQLERALNSESRSTRIYRLLATAYGRLGKTGEAKLHLAEEALLQGNFSYARQHAQSVLEQEKNGSKLWIKAKDILSFVESAKKE